MRIDDFTTVPVTEFSLSNAVQFHDELNPNLFEGDKLRSDIRKGLLKIAEHFEEFIGVELDVVDVTISGSNAAYSYTSHSDIDLHIVVQVPDTDEYRQLLDAKKNDYNAKHDITVKNIPVELYAQDVGQDHHSVGIYSVLNDGWISEPERIEADINSDDVKSKYYNYRDRLKSVLDTDQYDVAKAMWDDIKRMRKAGLESKASELSAENLVYKMLRNKLWIEKLQDHMNNLVDKDLSIEGRQ
jgi:hypothetical protein